MVPFRLSPILKTGLKSARAGACGRCPLRSGCGTQSSRRAMPKKCCIRRMQGRAAFSGRP